MKTFYIQNRITHEEHMVQASSAQEACAKCGWMIGDCYVREMPSK